MPFRDSKKRKEWQKEYGRRPSTLEARRRRYILFREVISKQKKASYQRHAKEIAIRSKKFYKKNRKKIIAKAIEYYNRNREKTLAQKKIYYAKNKETISPKNRLRGKKWYEKNKTRVREKQKMYAKVYPEKAYAIHHRYISKKKLFGGSFSSEEWQSIIEKQKGICLRCKKEKKLSIDHKIPVTKWEAWALENNPKYKFNDIENIQGLCQPCNASKSNKLETY